MVLPAAVLAHAPSGKIVNSTEKNMGHQHPRCWGDDTVAVMVRVAGEQRSDPGRRAVHGREGGVQTDLASINGQKPKVGSTSSLIPLGRVVALCERANSELRRHRADRQPANSGPRIASKSIRSEIPEGVNSMRVLLAARRPRDGCAHIFEAPSTSELARSEPSGNGYRRAAFGEL